MAKEKIALQSISASSRWLSCTASLLFNKDFNINVNTLKGNLIHEVSALKLREIFFNENHEKEIEKLKTEKYIDERNKELSAKWDSDCKNTCEKYVSYALKMFELYQPHTIEIEKKIDLEWHGYKKIGNIDLVMISNDYMIIIDLKSGRTKIETDDNSQMLMYMVALIQEEQRKGNVFIGKYIISICQSLIANIVAYEYSLNSIARFYASQSNAMEEISSGNLKYRPSKKACKYCDHRDSCNERIKQGIV